MSDSSSWKTMDAAIAVLEKAYGAKCVQRLGKAKAMRVAVISTGVLSFDAALGVGGVPRGRVIEIYGPEAGGKTTLALQIIAQAHATGGMAAFVDAEHALDPKYARALGVNVDDLLISQPDCGEQALEITEGLIRTNVLDVLVVDSVAALVPRAELDGEFGDSVMGLQARLMSQAMRKLCGATSKSKTCLIFINQLREKIGVMFGNPEVTTGGRALKFYSSQRIEVRKGQPIKDGDRVIGSLNKFKVVKNKVAAPFCEAEVELLYGRGYSQIHDLLHLASDRGIIEKSGSWYAFKGERIGQGKEQAVAFLEGNPEIAQKIFTDTRILVMPPTDEAPTIKEK
jgi:recombination protein RecA